MKKLYLLLLWLFLTLPVLLSAQEITWEKLNGPSGGGGTRVYAGKDGYIFTLVPYVGLMRSHDSGLSWETLPANPFNSWNVSFSIGNNGTLYIGKGASIYRSVNNGTWWTLPSSNSISHNCILALSDGVILISNDNNEIKRSSNNAQSWQTVVPNTSNKN